MEKINIMKCTTEAHKNSFTLAEVLITLGIIGIVAAMTLPSLMSNYRKNVVVNQLKKEYSQLEQALKLSIAENGMPDGWEGPSSWGADESKNMKKFAETYFAPYLKILKNSTKDEMPDYKIKYLDGTLDDDGHTRHYLTLTDGSIYIFRASGVGINWGISVSIDVNGTKAPNTHGHDVFVFSLDNQKGYFYANWENITREFILSNQNSCCCNKERKGSCCAKLIMLDGWTIKDDYPVKF